jgi:hypothetical protein
MVAWGASLRIPSYGSPGVIARVQIHAQPGGVHHAVNPQQGVDVGGESPVVFERQHDAEPLTDRNQLLDGADAPADGVLVRVAGQRRLLAFYLHQLVERGDRLPAARIQAHAGNAEARGQLEASPRVLDVAAALVGGGEDEVLMDGQHRKAEPAFEGSPLQRIHIRGRFVPHLPVKDLDPFKADGGGVVDDILDGNRSPRKCQ